MKKKQSNLTIFAILTTITILTWVFSEGYRRFYNTETTAIPIKILAPFTPTLDLETLSNLGQKKYFTQEEIGLFKPNISQKTTNTEDQVSQPSASESSTVRESTSSGESN